MYILLPATNVQCTTNIQYYLTPTTYNEQCTTYNEQCTNNVQRTMYILRCQRTMYILLPAASRE